MLNSYNNGNPVWDFSEEITTNRKAVIRVIGMALMDLFLLIAIALGVFWKQGNLIWSAHNCDILCMFFGVWLPTSLVLRKFEKDNFNSSKHAYFVVLMAIVVNNEHIPDPEQNT